MLAPQLDALESEVFVGDADAFAMQLSDGDPATVCCILLVKTCRDPRRSKTDLRPRPRRGSARGQPQLVFVVDANGALRLALGRPDGTTDGCGLATVLALP